MRVRGDILLLLLLAWPHQGYAQTRATSTDSSTVASWFGAMRGDLTYALQAPTRWSRRDGLKIATLALTVGGLVHLADEDINREFSQDEDHLLLSPVRGLLPLGEKYDTIPSIHMIVGKQLLGRARPYVGSGSEDFNLGKFGNQQDFQSMPSGHSLEAFATMTVLAKRYPHWWVQLPAYSVAGGIAAQRIDTHKHWVSDVVLGGTIGYQVARMLVDHAEGTSADPPAAIRLSCDPTGLTLAVTF